MKELLLSIVIPMYNIENYIERCLKSFEKIDYKLLKIFEVIIVNDGSTDSSVKIVEEYLSRTKLNLKLINKKNGGHGSAVNKGIENAKGKYFKIVDGDDWVNSNAFELYLSRIIHTNADLIITDYSEQHTYSNKTIRIKPLIVEDNHYSTELMDLVPMHSITYKTELLQKNNIRLTEKIFYVDTQYAIFPLKYVKKWEYWSLDLYQYFLGRPDQSMAIENRLKNIEHNRIVIESILEYYDRLNPGKFKDLLYKKICDLINARLMLVFYVDNRDELIKKMVQDMDKYNIKYPFQKNYKTTYLLYINEKTNRILTPIIYPIVNYKLKNLFQ